MQSFPASEMNLAVLLISLYKVGRKYSANGSNRSPSDKDKSFSSIQASLGTADLKSIN